MSSKTDRPHVIAVYSESHSVPPKERSSDIRVVLVSDTHNVLIPDTAFPEGDLLLHAGDHTASGTKGELQAASDWLLNIAERYTHGCVTIGGNHDLPLDTDSLLAWNSANTSSPSSELPTCGTWTNDEVKEAKWKYFSGPKVKLLHHEAISIAGLSIFCSPFVPTTPSKLKLPLDHPRRSLGFNKDEKSLKELYQRIPANVDVLMTHTPPFTRLDVSYQYGNVPREKPVHIGSHALNEWISTRYSLKDGYLPALHVFGHEHDSRGILQDDSLGGVYFVNAAAVDGDRGTGGYTLKESFTATVVDFRILHASL